MDKDDIHWIFYAKHKTYIVFHAAVSCLKIKCKIWFGFVLLKGAAKAIAWML